MRCWNPVHKPPMAATAYATVEEDNIILVLCPHCSAVAERDGARVRSFLSLNVKKPPAG